MAKIKRARLNEPSSGTKRRKSKRMIKFKGKEMTMSQWAAHLGMNYTTLVRRIERGMSPKEALTTPTRNYRKI